MLALPGCAYGQGARLTQDPGSSNSIPIGKYAAVQRMEGIVSKRETEPELQILN